jgi:hypothetical protein
LDPPHLSHRGGDRRTLLWLSPSLDCRANRLTIDPHRPVERFVEQLVVDAGYRRRSIAHVGPCIASRVRPDDDWTAAEDAAPR